MLIAASFVVPILVNEKELSIFPSHYSLWLIRRSPAATAAQYLPSRTENRSSTQVRTCPRLSAARTADRRASPTVAAPVGAVPAKCTTLSAPSALLSARFHSSHDLSRRVASPFSAVNASWRNAGAAAGVNSLASTFKERGRHVLPFFYPISPLLRYATA